MKEFLGDRKSLRFDVEKNCIIENPSTGVQHVATIKNFSGDGLKCESKISYKVGTTIIARINNWPKHSSRKCYLGEVRWCNHREGYGSNLFDVGIHIKTVYNFNTEEKYQENNDASA